MSELDTIVWDIGAHLPLALMFVGLFVLLVRASRWRSSRPDQTRQPQDDQHRKD